VTPAEVGRGLGHGGAGELRTACWVGGGGGVAASGHEGGVVVLWSVPPPSALANGSSVLDITPLHAYQPQAPPPPPKAPGRAFPRNFCQLALEHL